jgi:5-methylcytosine-specific restriction endonuclease McrA
MHESTFPAQMTDLGDCPLCGRKLVSGSSVNQHHLVPRSRNGRDTIVLHRICHAAIHAALSEKELERQYNTMERLREHPQLSRFIAGVRGKPPEFWVRTRRLR